MATTSKKKAAYDEIDEEAAAPLLPSKEENAKDAKDKEAAASSASSISEMTRAANEEICGFNKKSFYEFLMVFFCIITKTWQPLAVAASRDGDGYHYEPSTVVILTEVVKLVACGVALAVQLATTKRDSERRKLIETTWGENIHYIVPAILYAIANTLIFISLKFMNPALYHVLGNFKIITTGVLFKYFLGHDLSDIQWCSLILLTLGAISSMPEIETLTDYTTNTAGIGMLLVLIQCLVSTFASIYIEKRVKTTKQNSIFWQNIQLYIYGIIFNFIYLYATNSDWMANKGFFYGYDARTWGALTAQSIMGLSLSFVFKFLNNIVFVMACTVSMFLAAIISVWLFDFSITVIFIISLFVVTIAIYLYYRHNMPWVKAAALNPPEPPKSFLDPSKHNTPAAAPQQPGAAPQSGAGAYLSGGAKKT